MVSLNPGKANAGGKAEPAGLGSLLLRALLCVCLLSALVMTFFVVDVRLHTSNLMAWIDANPTRGFFVFIAFYSLATGTMLLQYVDESLSRVVTAGAAVFLLAISCLRSRALRGRGVTGGMHGI